MGEVQIGPEIDFGAEWVRPCWRLGAHVGERAMMTARDRTGRADTIDLVHTKLVPPQLRPQIVSRAALLGRLNAGLNCKLTLVSAPAGFGKTTLLADWLTQVTGNRGQGTVSDSSEPVPSVAWVALDVGDNDPLRFWRYVLAACWMFDPAIGAAAHNLLRASPWADYEAALTTLLNDLARLPRKGILVLEDYHTITTGQIHEQLTFLLDHLPATLQLVLLTRSDPPLPLARLRAQHDLNELRADDLRFSLAETQAFLRQAIPYHLPDDAIRHLAARTEGWVAGLRLISLALERHHDPQAVARMLTTLKGSHRHIVAYLVAEVLQVQTEQIQTFLLQTSCLGRLTAPLCDAVTGRNDSAAILEQLERANLFVVPLDEVGQWYRYHALFAEAMQHEARRRQGEEALRACSDRASAWYEQQGLLTEAVEAAFKAKAFARAAALIEQTIGPQHFQELIEYHTLSRWLAAVPKAILAQYPRLCLRFAMVLMFSADSRSPTSRAQMERSLSLAERRWQADGNRAGVGAVRAARAIMLGEQGEPALAARLAHDALAWISADDHNWRAGCLRLIGAEQLLSGMIHEARRTLLDARGHFEAAGNNHGMRAALLKLGDTCVLGGELRQAAELYRAVSTTAGGDLMDKGNALLGLARTSYEWNAVDAAEQDVHAALDIGMRLGDEPLQVHAALGRVRIQCARGYTAQAQHLLYALITQARRPLLIRAVESAQARLALAAGDMAAVERWYTTSTQPRADIPRVQQEQEALIVARMRIAQGDGAAALQILDPWRAEAHAAGRVRSELEILILTALSFTAQAKLQQAQQALLTALARAQLEGYVRLFLDEGEALSRLLRRIDTGKGPLSTYARTLLDAAGREHAGDGTAPSPVATPSLDQLTPQEQRVLQLLAAGRSNREMAQTLVISINTIKTHVKSIYRKLNVTNRVEASMVARRLNLL
jgi:LuxR family transcriptional regulator, maltose regulon positive regulatory protein